MTNKELRVSADTVLDGENELVFEGDYDHLKVMKLLKDKGLSPTARNVIKQQNYLHLYGGNTRRREFGTEFLKQRRLEGRTKTFQYTYGTQYEYISTKIKKGSGKGRYRLQKVKINPKNAIDNLNWLK